jgi:hypothetical protein
MAQMVPIYRIHHEFWLTGVMTQPVTWPITFGHVTIDFDYMRDCVLSLPTSSLCGKRTFLSYSSLCRMQMVFSEKNLFYTLIFLVARDKIERSRGAQEYWGGVKRKSL